MSSAVLSRLLVLEVAVSVLGLSSSSDSGALGLCLGFEGGVRTMVLPGIMGSVALKTSRLGGCPTSLVSFICLFDFGAIGGSIVVALRFLAFMVA